MESLSIRKQVQQLRKKGKTYSEIRRILKINTPKSTLSYWCRNVSLPKGYRQKILELNKFNFSKARTIALAVKNMERELFFKDIDNKNKSLFTLFDKNLRVRKMVLAILYLAEGSKTARGSLMFGNSDPHVVNMFVNLMRGCYKLNEQKFRCTVQCRADQNIRNLEKFWSKITKVPLSQFYKARIDKRSIGKISSKKDYKGVCRIDYFSSAVDLELKFIAQKLLGSLGPIV